MNYLKSSLKVCLTAIALMLTAFTFAQPTNLALNKDVSGSAPSLKTNLAVDGVHLENCAPPKCNSAEILAEAKNANSWLQVDLGAVYQIENIKVWNRGDGYKWTFKNLYVLVSEHPFTAQDPRQDANLTYSYQNVNPDENINSFTAPVGGVRGRYVRIFNPGDWTVISEVEVFGQNQTYTASPQKVNLAAGKAAKQSTTEGGNTADQAVDADNNSQSSTNWTIAPWWQVDMGNRYSVSEINLTPGWEDQLKDFFVIFSDNQFPDETLDYEITELEKYAVKVIRVSEGNKNNFKVQVSPAVTAQYVRIQRRVGAGGMPLQLKNVTMMGVSNPVSGTPPTKQPWPINLAAGKAAKQSTTEGTNTASNAVDANNNSHSETKWENTAWIQVDLQNSYALSTITIIANEWGQESPLENFLVIVSPNEIPGINLLHSSAIMDPYATLIKEKIGPRSGTYSVDLEHKIGRYVRIQTRKGGQPLRIREIQIIGSPNPSGTPPTKQPWAELLSFGQPFDADKENQYYSYTNEGPKIVALPEGSGQIDIAWGDTRTGKAKLSRYSNLNGSGSTKVWVKDVPGQLDMLGGFAKDGSGNSFVLTYKKEDMQDASTKNINTYRPNIAKMLKLNSSGGLIWEKDLGNNATYSDLPFFNPIKAGTSRLTYGGGKLGLITAKNYDWDDGPCQCRHQHAVRRLMDENGNAVITSGGYHGHSFDQRIMFDGSKFITLDRMEWGILMTKLPASGSIPGDAVRPVFTHLLQNNGQDVFTSLGGVAKGNNGYVVAFSAEQGDDNGKLFNRPRDMAMVHVVDNFDQITPKDNFPGSDQSIIVRSTVADTKTQNSQATAERDLPVEGTRTRKTSGIVWLTNYATGSGGNFETALRPKMVKLSSDRYVLVWEKWQVTNNNLDKYLTTMAMVIDEYGRVMVNARDIGRKRLNPDDDAFLYDGKAAWVIGETYELCFRMYALDANLNLTEYKLNL